MNKSTKLQLAVAGSVALAIVLALSLALSQANETGLRWWAGLSTVVLPVVGLIAYWLGRTEARGHVAGLTQGIDAVSKAAAKTTDVAQRAADIRVDTARRMRPIPAIQQMFLPPTLNGAQGGVILPPLQTSGDMEA